MYCRELYSPVVPGPSTVSIVDDSMEHRWIILLKHLYTLRAGGSCHGLVTHRQQK